MSELHVHIIIYLSLYPYIILNFTKRIPISKIALPNTFKNNDSFY